ncbi:MAG: hypothetical protein V3W18_06655 [candidate division Zixibacteria bacterium]
MSSKSTLAITMTLLMCLFLPATAAAQGFSAVLDKLDLLENRLDKLESDQKEKIDKLQYKLSNLGTDADYSELNNAVESLSSEVELLRSESSGQGEELSAYNDISGDLRGLVGLLRETITSSAVAANDPGAEFTQESFDDSIPLEITGFGDLFTAFYKGDETNNDFEIGQVEVDLETNIDEKIIIGAAIAYDAESETFGLGAFTVDIHLFDIDAGHFRPINGIDHSGVIIGQFDIPIGIDWYVYPSIDRKLVSAPLAATMTHDGWNDYGIQGYVDTRYFNAVVYGVNGFGYQTAYDSIGTFLGYNEWGYDPEDPTLDIQDSEMKFSFGGRIGVKPHELVEIGGSYGGFANQEDKLDMALTGFDIQFHYENFALKGEYISHKIGIADDNEQINSGYYGQGTYDFSNYFVVARYGEFDPYLEGVDNLTRFSAGIGWRLLEGCETRLEYQKNSEENTDVTYLQLVVGF